MIAVQYTCDVCGIKDAVVQVRERGATEDVREWMKEGVVAAITVDHRQKSPMCNATQITQLKIPLARDNNARVGDPERH